MPEFTQAEILINTANDVLGVIACNIDEGDLTSAIANLAGLTQELLDYIADKEHVTKFAIDPNDELQFYGKAAS